jgi:hypothetical protein
VRTDFLSLPGKPGLIRVSTNKKYPLAVKPDALKELPMKQLFSTVKSKIILVLTMSTMGTLIVGVFGVRGISTLSDSLHATYATIIVPTGHLSTTESDLLAVRLALWRMVAQKDTSIIP